MKKILFIAIPLVAVILIVLYILLFSSYGCSGSAVEISDAMSKYYEIYSIPNISEDDRLELLNNKVVDEYPNSEAAMRVRLTLSEKEYWSKHVREGVTNLVFNQGLYREKKKLLKDYPNSTILLLNLSALGYRVYPEEVIKHCNRVITIEPSKTEPYKCSGLSYMIMDKFDMALKSLNHGKGLLIERMIVELNKPIPYIDAQSKLPNYYAHDINFAKSYLRKLGFNAGEDVDYNLDKMRSGLFAKLVEFFGGSVKTTDARFAFTLTDNDSHTTLVDLYHLDLFIFYIKSINSGNPVFSSYMRVPVETHPLKKLKDN